MDSGHLDVLNFKDVLHVFGEVFPEHGVRHLQKEMGKKHGFTKRGFTMFIHVHYDHDHDVSIDLFNLDP